MYAEALGKRMGFFQDPASDYGRLNLELMRAVRLVVYTGINADGWTRDQTVEYFRASSAADGFVSNRSRADKVTYAVLMTIGLRFCAVTLVVVSQTLTFLQRANRVQARFTGAFSHSGGNHGGPFLYPQFIFHAPMVASLHSNLPVAPLARHMPTVRPFLCSTIQMTLKMLNSTRFSASGVQPCFSPLCPALHRYSLDLHPGHPAPHVAVATGTPKTFRQNSLVCSCERSQSHLLAC